MRAQRRSDPASAAHRGGWRDICLLALVLAASPGSAQTPLINEFMASNATCIADDDGDFSDWLELFNPGAADFDLTGCYLSDDAGTPLRWRFPQGVVPARGFLLVWASNKDRVGPSGALHTNFAIGAGGEPLLLTAADGVTRLDETGPVALTADLSYSRQPDGGAVWIVDGTPTPQGTNDAGLPILPLPVFSSAPGFFTAALPLAIAVDDPAAEIRYTLDGSEPTGTSALYVKPLVLDTRQGDPNTISLIPTNFWPASDHYGWRAPRVELLKLNLVRARAYRLGFAPSEVATGSYFVDPDPAARLPFPVISLATSPENLFDGATGIYVPGDAFVPGDQGSGNYFQRGDEWERPVHVELFDRQGNTLLAQDAGARIHGGYSRRFPQKTLRLTARSEYGPSEFDCALFPEQADNAYNCFLVRNAGNDWGMTGFKDLAIQTLCRDMGFDTQAGRPVIQFLDGEYWGLANLRERYDEHYLEREYGVPQDEAALLVENAEVEEGQPADSEDYLALRDFVSGSDLTRPENLAHVAERMDLENFIAYNVAEIYAANYDWPGVNIRYWRRTRPAYVPDAPYGHDGRWRWMMYDMDWNYAFVEASHNTLVHATAAASSDYANPPWSTELLRRLLGNEWFRDEFINACADHLNSTFAPARVIGVIDGFAELYAPAIGDWQDRWDVAYDWSYGVQEMRNFAAERPAHLHAHIVDHFGLAGTCELTLAINDSDMGKLQLNRLVIDGDLPGLDDPAAPYPWTGTYFQGVPITVTALPAPGHRFLAWLPGGSDQLTLSIMPGAGPLELTAVFATDARPPVLLHAWHFNDLPAGALIEVQADASPLGGGAITYPGTGAGYLDRVDEGTELGALPGTPAGNALRVRNPSDTRELILALPTTGHESPSLGYAAMRTANGAQEHSLHYRLAAGRPWLPVAEDLAVGEAFTLFTHDLSAIAGASDNPDFAVKFTFGGANAGGSSGNQRFDNVTLSGVALTGTNLPPLVTGPLGTQQATEGDEPLALDLSGVFTDPESDPLVYVTFSHDPAVAGAAIVGGHLVVTPLARGESTITVSAFDGYNDPVAHSFLIRVRPSAVAVVLSRNAPNPFSLTTRIAFSVRDGATGRLEIFDSRGLRVRFFGDFAAGDHAVTWQGDDDAGRPGASGVYFYQLKTGDDRWTGKMLMVR